MKQRKLNCTSTLGLPKPFQVGVNVNSQWPLSDLGSSSVGTLLMRWPTGVWWSVREDTSQHNCCNFLLSGWVPNQFYKLESLDSGSAQNAQLRYRLWVWATPNVPASGLLPAIQVPLNTKPDDNSLATFYILPLATLDLWIINVQLYSSHYCQLASS